MRKAISREMRKRRDAWKNVVSCTLTDAELDVDFDDDFGGNDGRPFTLWTAGRVYFPVTYDGSEWVESVSREPDGKPTKHVGGGV